MNIFSLKSFFLVGTVAIGIGLTLPAVAQSHGGGHSGGGARSGGGHFSGGGRGGGGGWHRGGPGWWGVGLGLGLGWDASYYGDPYAGYGGYYSPYVPSAMIDESPAPPMPPEGNVAPPNPSAAAVWHYCDSAKGYYPYVNQCPEGWRSVPAAPPGSPQ